MPQLAFSRATGFGALFDVVEAQAGEAGLAALLHGIPVAVTKLGPMQLVPFHLMNTLFNRAARVVDDRLLGARIGLGFKPEDVGPFAEFAMHGETLRDIFTRVVASMPLHSSAETVDLRCNGPQAHWRMRYSVSRGPAPEHDALRRMMPALAVLKLFTQFDAGSIELNIAIPDRILATRLQHHLGLRVRPGRDDYEWVFPARWLDSPTPRPGWSYAVPAEELAPYFDRPLPPSTIAAVVAALDLAETAPDAGINGTARLLGLHRRALQRALGAENANYRDVMRHVRIERAAQLLTETDRPIAEIALRAGYSDQANFHRAFLAIIGMTPARFRSPG